MNRFDCISLIKKKPLGFLFNLIFTKEFSLNWMTFPLTSLLSVYLICQDWGFCQALFANSANDYVPSCNQSLLDDT